MLRYTLRYVAKARIARGPYRRRELHNGANGWKAVIGLEIHAQINSHTKLFSDSLTSFNAPVNSNISVIDAAFPGVQPTLNEKCVELAVRTAIALGSTVNRRSSFDRKHYFYPDLPQGYQITQHHKPVSVGGELLLAVHDGVPQPIQVRIEQIQLEQDTGKSIHDMRPDMTLLDLNRAGSGLMEIVTKPDMRQAGQFVKKLQALLRCVGSSNANMEEGSLRCDVNVSVHKEGSPWGTRCELKNLNSVRFLSAAIEAEIERQIEVLENGGTIEQETRGYDVELGKTFRLRGKETARDYRYMPETDLPSLILTQDYIDGLRNSMPELPDAKRERLMQQYNLSDHDAAVLLSESNAAEYFETVCQGRPPKLVVNWTTHELFGQLASKGIPFTANPVSTQQLGSVLDLIQSGSITGMTAKNVLKIMIEEAGGRLASDIVEEKGWKKVGDESTLREMCLNLMDKNPDKVASIRSGNTKLATWLIGQIMRDTRGLADPVTLNKVLEDALGMKLDSINHINHSKGKKSKKKGQ
ncbi:B subunit of glutamyl-tRNA amidotransferase [Umbelopsis sp. PMI_123]|nr:B subunit of glutamyl-tRNA amidotransferase [Umbelopsis sp. PMI_123]